MTDEEMLSARVPEELKRLVDADQRSNQEIVRAALWREFGGERKASVERRIEEKENRINMIRREKNEREREIEEEEQDLDALKAKVESIEEKKDRYETELEDAADLLPDPSDRDPDNPAVKAQASNLGVSPEELLDDLAERDL